MPSPEALHSELEADRAQRETEIRLISNIATRTGLDAEKNALRRSLVLVTYSHLEGFCKFALLSYLSAVNSERMSCGEASIPIVAASLGRALTALRELNSKHPVFQGTLPSDRELHLLWRERMFVEKYQELMLLPVEIPDNLVDTKSNLNTIVLKKNLYQLGLDMSAVDAHAATINELVNRRNAIAHGDRTIAPSSEDTERYIESTFRMMGFIQQEIYETFHAGAYRRAPEERAA